MNPFSIRRLHRSDAAQFQAIRLESLLLHPQAFGSSWEEEAGQSHGEVAERIEANVIFGGFSQDGQLLGTVAAARSKALKSRHIVTLWGVYVRGDARGTGLAHALVTSAVEEVRPSCRSIRLRVLSTNAPAIRLYKSIGFAEWAIDTEALLVDGTYHHEILMRLETGF